ncbi:MAG: hypothetical protein KDE48_12470 [Anaerolineales bacterium]|nr:hypothetical protein [Anaerolineales bacterium]
MPNEDSIVIQPGSEIILHTALPSELMVFDEEKRQKVIQVLRQIPAILDGAKKLSEGKTYKAYIAPEILGRIKDGSAKLAHRDNGLFGANILDVETGKIIHNASLVEVTPDLLNSLNELATQQTLANIVHRLKVIDEKITDVLQGQFNDRLAEVESGIHHYEQALVASHSLRRELMVSAIHDLNLGRNKLIKSTDFSFIDKLPRNRLRMLFSRNWDIPEYVQSKAEFVVKATHAIIEATHFLVMAYSNLNEPDSLRVSLEQVENEVKVFQDKTGEIVRWLSPMSNLHESLTTISQGVLPRINDLDEISQKSMVVEFQPKEILPPEGV